MLSLCCHVWFLLSSGKPAKLNVQNAPVTRNVRIKAMRNTYEFDQHAEWDNSLENDLDNNVENDFDDNVTEDSKSKRQQLRRKEQRSNSKRAPIEAFSEAHFASESRRR
ncbi:MAG: hypothetical protein ACI8SJ_000271 [Shewanella sp.]|jgi:hypothetical protein